MIYLISVQFQVLDDADRVSSSVSVLFFSSLQLEFFSFFYE